LKTTLTLDIRVAIETAIHSWYDDTDHGRASCAGEMFTSDARLTFRPGSPQPGPIEGTAITDAMMAREKMTDRLTRHAVTNIILRPGEEHGVVACYMLILFRSDDKSRSTLPWFVADMEDDWVESDGQWKIAQEMSER